MALEEYRSAFTKDHLLSGDVAVVSGSYMKIGEFKVQAGEMYSLGYGQNESQEGSPGRIYMDLKDNSTAPGVNVNGILRFSVHTPQGRPIRTLAEFRTETLRTDVNNRTLQVPFPSAKFPYVSEDKKIVIEFLADADTTISKSNSTIVMDTTVAVL